MPSMMHTSGIMPACTTLYVVMSPTVTILLKALNISAQSECEQRSPNGCWSSALSLSFSMSFLSNLERVLSGQVDVHPLGDFRAFRIDNNQVSAPVFSK